MARQASLKTIQTQIARLEKQAEALKLNAKPGLLQVVKLMRKHGLRPADIDMALAPPSSAGKAQGAGKAPAAGKRSKTSGTRSSAGGKAAAGRKVAPKYRDPVSGATWTGRGRSPKWVTEALAQGKSKESFAI